MNKHGINTASRKKAGNFPNVGKPLMDRVVIREAAAEEMSAGGILIPQTAQDKEKPLRGEVIAVGPGRKDEVMGVKPGDNVLYGAYAGTEVKIKGLDYVIMRECDILLILPD